MYLLSSACVEKVERLSSAMDAVWRRKPAFSAMAKSSFDESPSQRPPERPCQGSRAAR